MRSRRLLVLVGLLGALSLRARPTSAEERLESLRGFFETHCLDCHGAERQKGDVRFDTLSTDLSSAAVLDTWQAALDRLRAGDMPPAKRPRPDAELLESTLETLSSALSAAYESSRSDAPRTVLRRLNRFELRNTLRDLLHLQGPIFDPRSVVKLEDPSGNGRAGLDSEDPTREFPADEAVDGLDTIGERLVMSDFRLRLMISAAEESLARATWPAERPEVETRRYAGPVRTQGPGAGLEAWSREVHPEYDLIVQRYREPGAATGGAGRVTSNELAARGVGVAARYRVTAEVSAHHQRHPWGDLIRSRQDEPMLLGLHIADARRGGLSDSNPTSRKVAEWALEADGRRRSYSHETWLDATWTPWLGWENGPYERGLRPSRIVREHLPELYRPEPPRDASQQEKADYEPSLGKALLRAGYLGPHIRVHSLTLEPLVDEWPPPSHVALYGSGEETTEELIRRFARRAFRAPVGPDEVTGFVALAESVEARGADREEALRAAYTAVLASPRFAYLVETGARLTSHEIAARLSYFLWSSMPDEELFRLADEDRLRDVLVVRAQVDRLLDHPRAAAFTRHFTERWLRLDRLGAMPPERSGPFRIYWDRQLESQMVAQTDAFVAHLVRTDGSIRDIIDSDYTFLNERVASILYGRDDVWGDGFRKVQLNDPRRGGVLTQPAVMTATANGVDTSPVVRGVWVLESVLGTPPGPPPANVEPLAPDLRGAQTIREQLELHREDEACNECHRKIDPLGFALESFDPIGKWRDTYPDTRRPIDPSSKLASGREIADIVDLKRYLLEREEQVVRCLCEKLLGYASGRELGPRDRGEVDRIVGELAESGGGLRELIRLVATSDVFLSR